MRKHIGLITLAVLVVTVFVAYTVAYPVRATDLTFIKLGGKVDDDRIYDGREPDQTGLKFKWPYPIETVTRFDGRIRLFEDAAKQLNTEDKQPILLTMFCAWRIADPVKFAGDIKTVEDAENTLRDALGAQKGNVVGRYSISEFVNTDPEAMKLAEIEQEILDGLRDELEERYGVKIVMVGIKSLSLPETVTETVIEAMQAQQEGIAGKLQTTGKSEADAIVADADDASERIMAFAERKAAEIGAEGYREAGRLYEEFSADPGFAMYLRSLESLRKELADNTVFLLDGSRIPAVRFFTDGPSVPTDRDEQE